MQKEWLLFDLAYLIASYGKCRGWWIRPCFLGFWPIILFKIFRNFEIVLPDDNPMCRFLKKSRFIWILEIILITTVSISVISGILQQMLGTIAPTNMFLAAGLFKYVWDSALIREKTDQKKDLFWHIWRSHGGCYSY